MDDLDASPKTRLRLMSFFVQTFISSCIVSALYGASLFGLLVATSWSETDTAMGYKDFSMSALAMVAPILVSMAVGGFISIPFSVCPGIPILYYQVKYNKLSFFNFMCSGVIAGIIVGLFIAVLSKKSEVDSVPFWIMTGFFINAATYLRCYRPVLLDKTLAKIKKATS